MGGGDVDDGSVVSNAHVEPRDDPSLWRRYVSMMGRKRTLPLVVGVTNAKRAAYGLVAIVNGVMLFTPHYWKMFHSVPPVYAISVAIETPMCLAASRLPLERGQRLLKKSIYVLLTGMISGLLIRSWLSGSPLHP